MAGEVKLANNYQAVAIIYSADIFSLSMTIKLPAPNIQLRFKP